MEGEGKSRTKNISIVTVTWAPNLGGKQVPSLSGPQVSALATGDQFSTNELFWNVFYQDHNTVCKNRAFELNSS